MFGRVASNECAPSTPKIAHLIPRSLHSTMTLIAMM